MTSADHSEPAAVGAPGTEAGPARPVRPARALGELVLAAALVGLAIWLWQLAVTSIAAPPVLPGGPTVEVSSYDGSWITLACILVAVAGLLVIDGIRRLRRR